MDGIIIEPLNRSHNRNSFDCGIAELNGFLTKFANQNQKNSISKTFVAIQPPNKKDILGFYTLTTGQINFSQLPDQQKHPRHPVSIARLARLAVNLKAQGKGVGGNLLFDALEKVKVASNMIGIFAVVVDAKDKNAQSFYKHYGFVELKNPDMALCLPMKTINKLFPECRNSTM